MRLNESLEHLDMEDKVTPLLLIDEFKSQIGDDSDIIVLTFIVDGLEVGEDLVDWLERGYDFIIDAEVSPGEVLDKKYYVFAEMNRRSSASFRIIEIVEDLKTLTGIEVDGWEVKINGEKYQLGKEVIKQHLTLSPAEYKQLKDGELNEWREIAGLKTSVVYEQDEDIKNIQRQAGII